MSRNSSGTYNLPSGNPVVGGTTISTTWANSTLQDLQSEMTDSLCRSGKGAMLAPLQLDDGTAAAPALTWDGDPDSGIYRAGAGDVRMQVDATQTQRWTATGVTLPVPVTVTTAISNTTGLSVTGNGTGVGITSTGGATSANGVAAVGGAPNGDAVYGQGTGTGTGLVGAGGTTSGPGVEATGGAPNGVGLIATGAGTGSGITGTGGATGAGGTFTPGTAATASVRASAIVATSGDVAFTSVTNPNSNVAFTNTLTAKNIAKAWALISVPGNGATSATITDGFNISGASVSGTTLTLTLASAISSAGVALVDAASGGGTFHGRGVVTAFNTVRITAMSLATAPPTAFDIQASVNTSTFQVVVFGAQ